MDPAPRPPVAGSPVAVISAVLAAVAVGGVVMLYFRTEDLSDQLRSLSRDGSPEARLTVESSEPRSLLAAEGLPSASAQGTRPLPGPQTRPAPAPAAATLEERIERLEADRDRLAREVERTRDQAGPAVWRGPRSFARNVDDLSTRLNLTPTQRARIQDAVDRGKQRIDEILRIPDETGKSPYERREEQRKKLQEALKDPGKAAGGVLALAGDLVSYRESRIPGRNETYGQEIERVQKETRDEISQSLDASQKEAFADTNIDAMLGGGGSMALAITSFQSADGDHEVLVGTGATLVEEPAEQEEANATDGDD